MLLVPVDDSVVFPNMTVTLTVDVGDDERVLLVPREDDEFASVGTVAEVVEHVRLPGGGRAVALAGLHRGIAGAAHTDASGDLRVEVTPTPTTSPWTARPATSSASTAPWSRRSSSCAATTAASAPSCARSPSPAPWPTPPATRPTSSYEDKVDLLETLDVTERLEKALKLQRDRLTELQVRSQIRDDVQSGADKQQREYFLRKQMESIRKELGDDDASVAEEYRKKVEEAGMPEAVREQADKEIDRLERMGEQSGESSMIRTYLDWLVSVPWSERSDEVLDPVKAREVLDADHAGLEDVKDRIVEHIGVMKLRKDRGIDDDDDRKSGAILTLIGPPGTGKTSIGESIARATGREFVRMSLGGVRDEAEIRGHRRTYIGALPGRLVRALRDAEDDEPGDHARRGRQGRRRLARRPSRGAARGARPGAEPQLPRPLPGRGAGPVAGDVHRHRQRGRHDPGAAARPHGGRALRRLHGRGEGGDRARLPVAAPAQAQRAARGRGDRGRRGRCAPS